MKLATESHSEGSTEMPAIVRKALISGVRNWSAALMLCLHIGLDTKSLMAEEKAER